MGTQLYLPAEPAMSEPLYTDPVHFQQSGSRGHPCPLSGSSRTQPQPEVTLLPWEPKEKQASGCICLEQG